MPYLNLPWPYHDDRNVTGGLLRCGGRLYLKGLGVHSAARSATRWTARIAVSRRSWASTIRPAAAAAWNFAFWSTAGSVVPAARSAAARRPCRSRSTWPAAKRLDLSVDYGERGDVLDHADWLDARLVK